MAIFSITLPSNWLHTLVALLPLAAITCPEAAVASPRVFAAENTFILTDGGQLIASGMNGSGQLGIGDTFSRSLFHTLPAIPDVADFWAGRNVSYLKKANGTLWSCGSNYLGLAGLGGSPSSTSSFLQVGMDTNWKQVSIGLNHVIGVRTDGTLWSWGYGSYGQLGLGSSSIKTTPTRIGTASDWMMVAAGNEHSLAIKTDGTLWAWGRNESGRLGDGTTTNRNAPVQIGSSNQWQSISAGEAHSLAVQSDGSLWAWGGNGLGQLGDSSNSMRIAPVQIGAGQQWKSASAGSSHSLALKVDNTLWTWGANAQGQLGLGDTTARNSPQQVAPGETWIKCDAGFFHSVAVKSDGSIALWGSNAYGQLGPAPASQTTPQAPDYSTRPEISVSLAAYPSGTADLVASGQGLCSFPLTAEEAPQSLTVKLYNHGTLPLDISSISLPAGFAATPAPPFSLQPGAMLALVATIDTTQTGNLSGQLIISSNDADEAEFVVLLSGTVLARANDSDGDGLNDAAEWHFKNLGFDWNASQPDLANTLFQNAPRAGLCTDAQLLAARPGSILLKPADTSGLVGMKLQLEQSSDLGGFSPADLSGSSITQEGLLDLPMTLTAPSGFYRFSASPPTASEP